MSSAGGKAEPLTSLAEGEVTQLWPQVLPGGKAVLYTSSGIAGAYNDANLVVQPLPGGARKVVQRGGYHGRYLPSGHLVYIHDGTLFAAPFDLDRLEVTGQPVPALEGVTSNAVTGGAQFAVSASGTLVYLPGQSSAPAHRSTGWITREDDAAAGHARELVQSPLRARWPPARHGDPRGPSSDIWVYEWARDTLTRLTFDPAGATKPVWTPDGRRIVFASARADKSTPNLYWQRADGTGDAQRLTESKNAQRPASWHPSGKFLAFEEQNPQTKVDLMILPMEGDDASGWKPGKPTVFLNSPSAEREPMFSPDGRWLAYSSNESGRNEVYVRPFPGPGGKWQISTGGGPIRPGRAPNTSSSMASTDRSWSRPSRWKATRSAPRSRGSGPRGVTRRADQTACSTCTPTASGSRSPPAAQTPGGAKQDKVVFIFNFFDELRRIAPATKR